MSSNGALNNGSEVHNPRVIMWCVPRAVSTAFTKFMSFVEGAEIWLEPYVIAKACEEVYDLYHPDNDNGGFPRTLEGNEATYRETAEQLTLGGDVDSYILDRLSPVTLKRLFDSFDPEKKFVFIKDMAVGMTPSRYQYLPDKTSGFKHFFLIRHPVKVYKSYRKGVLDFLADMDDDALKALSMSERPDPKTFHCLDAFPHPKDGTAYNFKAAHELWTHIRKTADEDPVVLDIDEMLDDPAAMLPVLFQALGIPYTDSLLSWDASSDVVRKWQSTCPNILDAPRYVMWFTNAFKSSCFKRSSTSASLDDEDATADIKEIAEIEMPFYEEMYKTRIKVQ